AKTAAILCDWIEEKPEEAIVEKYGIGPGDLFNLIRTAGWLLYSFYELAKILGEINVLKDLMVLRERVLHGVKSELIELTRLKNIGRKRARILYNAGLKTLEDIKRAGYRKLVSLPLIGPSLAKEILEQLGVKIEAQITIRNKTRTGTLEDYFQ
ncbi:MAG TPA: ATP-dependent DNA helicase, partial [Thermoproteales archaeon]|nr:ATP-dependent DNA helicase [Thermoproteales archaeon]